MRKPKAQSILEYAVLLAVVISAIMIMQVYVKRGYQGRIKQEADNIGPQYAVGHTTSLIITNTSMESVSYSGGTTKSADWAAQIPDGKVIPDGMSVSYSVSNTTLNRHEVVDSLTAK